MVTGFITNRFSKQNGTNSKRLSHPMMVRISLAMNNSAIEKFHCKANKNYANFMHNCCRPIMNLEHASFILMLLLTSYTFCGDDVHQTIISYFVFILAITWIPFCICLITNELWFFFLFALRSLSLSFSCASFSH